MELMQRRFAALAFYLLCTADAVYFPTYTDGSTEALYLTAVEAHKEASKGAIVMAFQENGAGERVMHHFVHALADAAFLRIINVPIAATKW